MVQRGRQTTNHPTNYSLQYLTLSSFSLHQSVAKSWLFYSWPYCKSIFSVSTATTLVQAVIISLPKLLQSFFTSPLVFTLVPFTAHPTARVVFWKWGSSLSFLLRPRQWLFTVLRMKFRILNVIHKGAAHCGSSLASSHATLLSSLSYDLFSSLTVPCSF